METLDELDYKLLDLLQKNAKAPTKYLAAEIGLSVTPTFERIKRMERLGIIKGYTVSLDKTKIGKGLRVLCQVSLTEHKEELIALFEKEIKLLDEVTECMHIAGNFDYLVIAEVKDIQAYEFFLKQKLAKLVAISNVQSSFVLGSPVSI
jgi:Lrp/AsnC family leucine-responsive transcriptional regulator